MKTTNSEIKGMIFLYIYQLNFFDMLRWAVIFLIIAIIAGVFGFTGIAAGAATIAKVLFFLFLILFIGALLLGGSLFKGK